MIYINELIITDVLFKEDCLIEEKINKVNETGIYKKEDVILTLSDVNCSYVILFTKQAIILARFPDALRDPSEARWSSPNMDFDIFCYPYKSVVNVAVSNQKHTYSDESSSVDSNDLNVIHFEFPVGELNIETDCDVQKLYEVLKSIL